ncbi:glutathione S-transferase A-like [Ylistrum balloti]|uniref:glutathione S-transferase A-like n=1 Tax=Ylistrum balloti TaxID=509963 RepID=UPI002905D22D|nr:glutathione S-transferase A-like [Ylistrum balloti]
MGKEDMHLIWGSGSGPCWKAMIALAEKGFDDIEKTLIEFSKKGHKSKEVMELNSRGQVPTFKDGDIIVNESMAICLYLEKAYPNSGTKLLPEEVADYAKVIQLAIEAQENLNMKIMIKCIYFTWMTPEEKREGKEFIEAFENNIKDLKEELKIWEKHVKESESGHVGGKAFSLADVVLYTFVAYLVRFGSSLDDYPNLLKYYKNLGERPSIAKTFPPHWKEGPLEGKKLLFKGAL